MSQFMHAREYLEAGSVVVVSCSHQCNVRVMEDSDYASFKRGGRHNYYGGFFTRLPARIPVPHGGYWNTTIDLGGGSANIRCNVSYLKE